MTVRNDRMNSPLQDAVDRVRTWPVVERLRQTRAKRVLDTLYSLVAPIWFSRNLHPRFWFAIREMTRRFRDKSRLWRYSGPDGETVFWIRHNWIDAWIVEEIFSRGIYEPPAEVSPHLPQSSELRVLDLGGNIGLFGLFALRRWPSASVTTFEPDPANLDALRRNHAESGWQKRWALIEEAAAAEGGSLVFVSTGTGNSHAASTSDHLPTNGTVEVPAQDVLPLLAGVDLLKIDIEGGEWPILLDSRFGGSGPRVVVAEYHDVPGLGTEPRTLISERLSSLGYTLKHLESADAAASVGVVWAWRG